MSDVKTSSQFESDDEEDIFRAAFSTPGQKAQSSGKIKISGSQEGLKFFLQCLIPMYQQGSSYRFS